MGLPTTCGAVGSATGASVQRDVQRAMCNGRCATGASVQRDAAVVIVDGRVLSVWHEKPATANVEPHKVCTKRVHNAQGGAVGVAR